MASYKYEVVGADGKPKTGTIEAMNMEVASAELKSGGNTIVSITRANAFNKDLEIHIGKAVSVREMSVFCRQFESVLNAGVTVVEALDMLSEQTENKPFANAIAEVRDSVQRGETLAVAMAEHLCGSEQAFVARMNDRARELGLKDTNFKNCTGLFEDDEHYTSAYDIAVMSRELIRHDMIKDYTTIWMDTIRGGEFGLSNTNKLVYYYDGCTGLKTGFTEKAMYCLSATAEREGVEYIAVIMHADTIDKRNNDAKALLSYGFANYRLMPLRSPDVLPPVRVTLGSADSVQPVYDGAEAALVPKSGAGEVSYELDLPDTLPAPVEKGQQIGTLRVVSDGKELYSVKLLADSSVARASFGRTLLELVKSYVGLG